MKHPAGPRPGGVCAALLRHGGGQGPVTKMQFVDLNNGWWRHLLKADKMSMANSLELRVPSWTKKIMALAGAHPLEVPGPTRRTPSTPCARLPCAACPKVGGQAGLPGAYQVAEKRTSITTSSRSFGERTAQEVLPHGEADKAAGRPQKRQGGQQPPCVQTVYAF